VCVCVCVGGRYVGALWWNGDWHWSSSAVDSHQRRSSVDVGLCLLADSHLPTSLHHQQQQQQQQRLMAHSTYAHRQPATTTTTTTWQRQRPTTTTTTCWQRQHSSWWTSTHSRRSVYLSLCLLPYLKNHTAKLYLIFMHVYCSCGSIRLIWPRPIATVILPVSCMTSCLYIMGPMALCPISG